MVDKKQRRLFIIVRGRLLDDKDDTQLVQFIVPGFNMVMNFECPVGTSDEEISDKRAEFLLKANGYLADWEQALASADADIKAKYPGTTRPAGLIPNFSAKIKLNTMPTNNEKYNSEPIILMYPFYILCDFFSWSMNITNTEYQSIM